MSFRDTLLSVILLVVVCLLLFGSCEELQAEQPRTPPEAPHEESVPDMDAGEADLRMRQLQWQRHETLTAQEVYPVFREEKNREEAAKKASEKK
jgi:hypothetical protein